MINANELRMGNWIDVIGGTAQQVTHIRKQFVKDGDLYLINSRLPEHCLPITLTPEVLEACGFEKHRLARQDYYELKINEKEKFAFEAGGCVEYGIMGVSQYEWSEVKIAYLHELQNAYHSLTGKEIIWNDAQ